MLSSSKLHTQLLENSRLRACCKKSKLRVLGVSEILGNDLAE